VGTVAYLSPEAANGKAPDPTFDLWGLTLSLYEAIAGTNPLRGATTQETLYRIFTLQLPRLDQLSPGCPPHVAQFFADALASDRAQRPDSARALGRSLTELAASLPGFSSAQHLAL
jgi:serine/threonine protein kinase